MISPPRKIKQIESNKYNKTNIKQAPNPRFFPDLHQKVALCPRYRGDLDSAALRLAMLVPGGVSSQAKGLLRGVLAGAHRRAVQMMAMGILQRAFRWLTQR